MAAHDGPPNDSPAYRFQGSTSKPQATVTHTHTHTNALLAVPYFILLLLLADVNEIQKMCQLYAGEIAADLRSK